MAHRRSIHTLTAWLAVLALLWAGVLPLMSHVLVPQVVAEVGMVEVCTVTGMTWIKTEGGSTDSADTSRDSIDPNQKKAVGKCDWCARHTLNLGLLATVSIGLLLPAHMATRLMAFWRAPRPLFAWAAARPRAPPSVG